MPGAPDAPEARNRYEGDPMVGTVLNDKFCVHAVLANGGMGRIYRGEQLPLGRPVAIKVLHSKYTSSQEDPAFQKRFFLEASILSKLQHPNIVTVFDYGRIEGNADESYFLAMEFLQGETLHRRLRALGALPPVEAIGLIRQIARGLREAHRTGVVHRDLKPSNIMLVPEEGGHEIVKIIDFGLVKVLADDSEELTKEGSFLGSPRYMSPEQIAHGKVDLRTDIYSVGVILYQCLCGRVPFENENSVHTLMAHLQLPVPPMRERNPSVDVPEVLETFVRRCLEKDSANRPGSMEEFLRGLRECEVALGLAQGASTTQPSGQFGVSAPPPALPASGQHTPSDPTLLSTSHSGGSQRASPSAFAETIPSVSPRRVAPLPIAAGSAPQKSRALPLTLAGGVALLCVVAAIFAVRTKSAVTQPPAQPPTAATGLREYRLVIGSNTSGAQVYEGSTLLGATPLTLTIDNVTARSQPRRFEVRQEGFDPFAVTAGPSEVASVQVTATPVAHPSQTLHEPPPAGVGNTHAVTRPVPPRPPIRVPRPPHNPTAPPPDDIRTHR